MELPIRGWAQTEMELPSSDEEGWPKAGVVDA